MIKIGTETRDKIGIGMIVDMDFAYDLQRPNWSRYLQCCLNFKINRFKQMTVDRSVHSVNFSKKLKHQRKILKGKLRSKKSLAQMREREKCKKEMSHH